MNLSEMQHWFGTLISQPLQLDEMLPEISPFGTHIHQEAEKYIASSPTLKPYQRIQIYHQQYWWRLLKCLQENFPTVLRLFGYEAFQSIFAIPYLATSPPSDWALCKLGATFPKWIEENYVGEDSYLVMKAAEIDWAAGCAFWAGESPLIESYEREKLFLQPHVHLFSLYGDFFSFRAEFLKNPVEYYNTNPFPKITYGEQYFVLYRAPSNVVTWERVSHAAFTMLSLFKEGSTLDNACAEIEKIGGEILEESLAQIPLWFKQWTVLKWFGQS